MSKALLLIDIQNDYFSGGKMTLVGMDQAAENAKQLLSMFREKQLPVYHIQHIANRPNATFFLPNSTGAEIHTSVAPLTSEVVIQKHYPNSFRATNLLSNLQEKNIQQLIIAGAMSHMCIDATTRAAFDYEFDCTVIEDACATKNLKFGELEVTAKHIHAGFMSALQSVYAKVKPLKEFKLA